MHSTQRGGMCGITQLSMSENRKRQDDLTARENAESPMKLLPFFVKSIENPKSLDI